MKERSVPISDDREIQKPRYKLGQLVRPADIKQVFGEGDSNKFFI